MLRIDNITDAENACRMFRVLGCLGILGKQTAILNITPTVRLMGTREFKRLVNEVQIRLMEKEIERETEAPTQR